MLSSWPGENAVSEKTIRVTCDTKLSIPWEELHEIQGKLKTMPPDRFNDLRQGFISDGINFPLSVWKELVNLPGEDGADRSVTKWWIVDGHGRKLVRNELVADGWTVPDAPCVAIEAVSLADAKRRVLAASSKFNMMTEDGLRDYVREMAMPPGELDRYHFDEIDMPKFKVSLQDELLAAGLDPSQTAPGATEGEPERAKDESNLPTEDEYRNAAIKQVVLYYPADIFPKVLEKLDAVMQMRGKQDYSEVVVALLDEALPAQQA